MSPATLADHRTIGERVDAYERNPRFMMFTQNCIPADEPLVRALCVKRQIWAQEMVVDGLDKLSWAYDVEHDYLCGLRDQYRDIITGAWLGFLARQPTFGRKPAYQNAVSIQAPRAA